MPVFYQRFGVGDIQSAEISTGKFHVMDHFHPVFHAEQLSHAILIRLRQSEHARLGADAVIQGYIGARLGKGAKADGLERAARIEQWVDQHDREHNEKDGKTHDEF